MTFASKYLHQAFDKAHAPIPSSTPNAQLWYLNYERERERERQTNKAHVLIIPRRKKDEKSMLKRRHSRWNENERKRRSPKGPICPDGSSYDPTG